MFNIFKGIRGNKDNEEIRNYQNWSGRFEKEPDEPTVILKIW